MSNAIIKHLRKSETAVVNFSEVSSSGAAREWEGVNRAGKGRTAERFQRLWGEKIHLVPCERSEDKYLVKN